MGCRLDALRRSHAGGFLRHGTPWRYPAFVLLVLAAVAYAGLPSNPPIGLDLAPGSILTDPDSHGGSGQIVAPTQAKEYRSRDPLAGPQAATGQSDAPPALVPTAAFHFSGQPAACGILPRAGGIVSGRAFCNPSRAPPAPLII